METKNSLFSSALKNGLIIGAVSIVLFIIMYVADYKPVGIATPIIVGLLGFAINIVILVILFKKYRTQIGGFISFRDAFLYCLIALVTASLLSTAFTMLFIQFVEPDYYKNIMEAQKTYMENYLSGKVSDEQMAQTLDKIDAQAANMGSLASTAKNFLIGVIVNGIIALIVGAVMKKNPEIFDDAAGGTI
jgi:Co/Zn/Cd efflux system component